MIFACLCQKKTHRGQIKWSPNTAVLLCCDKVWAGCESSPPWPHQGQAKVKPITSSFTAIFTRLTDTSPTPSEVTCHSQWSGDEDDAHFLHWVIDKATLQNQLNLNTFLELTHKPVATGSSAKLGCGAVLMRTSWTVIPLPHLVFFFIFCFLSFFF